MHARRRSVGQVRLPAPSQDHHVERWIERRRRAELPVPARSQRLRHVLVVLLACVAGGVDAFSYVNLDRVFPANMTGNTVQLGLAIAQLEWEALSRSGVALLGYVAGVAVGASMVRNRTRGTWSASMTRALLLEVVILSTVAALYLRSDQPQHGPLLLWLIALSSAAMGVQSAAVQGLSIAGVATTYITGTITTAVSRIVQRVQPVSGSAAGEDTGRWRLLVTIWCMYLASAIGTVAALEVSAHLALGVPITLLAIVIVTAAMWSP